MNGQVDARKLVSSLTLFKAVATYLLHQGDTSQDFMSLATCCERILTQTSKQGYFPCMQTLNFVASQINPGKSEQSS